MKLHKKESKYKHALALQREYNKLLRQRWQIEPIKLPQPIHNGYVKYLVLNDEVKRRKDYQQIKECFEMFRQTKVYSKDKKFLDKKKKIRKPGLSKIYDPRFIYYPNETKRSLDIEKISRYSKYLRYVPDIFSADEDVDLKHFTPYYTFANKHWLEEKIDDHWLTHYTPVDGELESRLKEIEKEMKDNHYWELISSYNWDKRDGYKNEGREQKERVQAYLHNWPQPVYMFNYE